MGMHAHFRTSGLTISLPPIDRRKVWLQRILVIGVLRCTLRSDADMRTGPIAYKRTIILTGSPLTSVIHFSDLFRSMQALHGPMQLRQRHQHAGMTIAQEALEPGTRINERRRTTGT
jgi:hypothetical protein